METYRAAPTVCASALSGSVEAWVIPCKVKTEQGAW
jgi:hypothetical protein